MSKGLKTRQRIVAEAAGLFNRHGFEGCSLSSLMAATRLEKGGIYRHFSSKEQLAAEAFDYAWRSASDARLQNLHAIANSVDRLKQFVANFVEWKPSVAGGCPMFNTAVDSDDGNPVLRARAQAALHDWLSALASIVRKGIAAGEIRHQVQPRSVAAFIISSLEGALILSRLERSRKPLLAARTCLEDYLENQLRAVPVQLKGNRKRSRQRSPFMQ